MLTLMNFLVDWRGPNVNARFYVAGLSILMRAVVSDRSGATTPTVYAFIGPKDNVNVLLILSCSCGRGHA